MQHVRNFSIIAHIDHGKSTLADRFLEATGTIEKRKMRDQVLDSMDLERERGITIKMQPARMVYHPGRRTNADSTQKVAESTNSDFLYKDLTYVIRGILFTVRKNLGLGHKEQVYHNALEIEFKKAGLSYESKKNVAITYDGKTIGLYQPDFVVEGKVLIELKALPVIGRPQVEQVWSYLKGCDYKLALLVNFGSSDLEIKRIVYDSARSASAESASSLRESAGGSNQIDEPYILNLIDTPGHIDFAYEVSRALTAVEGVILLVDSTQGVQAQTLSVLEMARKAGCSVIPVVSKIDAALARVPETVDEIAQLLSVPPESVLAVSGRTGEGVTALLDAIVERIPPPKTEYLGAGGRALIFDFSYSEHRGVTMYLRVMDGQIVTKDAALLAASGKKLTVVETGWFKPAQMPCDALTAGEIGYVVSGIKEPGIALVGDTLIANGALLSPLQGYSVPRPVVWAGVYPDSQDGFTFLKQALARLRLSDAALSYEEEGSSILGKGFRCGFLGMLHMEIITERLKREFGIEPVITMPSIAYDIICKGKERETVYSATQFPDDGSLESAYERWVAITIITPPQHLSAVTQLLYEHEAVTEGVDTFGDGRMSLTASMPLRELMRGFFDRLKSSTSGFASLSYEFGDMRRADVVRLDILVAEEVVPAFSRIVSRRRVEVDARALVERLHEALPKQLFVVKIQAKADGRIIASRTISAMRKDVTGYLYGGDVTRKKKLLEKQKKGKERRGEHAKMHIPQDVFLKLVKPGDD